MINKMTICRLCLCENEDFFNIFEVNGWHGYVAAEVISDLLHFKVTDTDGYPHVVCETCLTKLTDFKVFKEQCHTSKVTYDKVFASEKSVVDHHNQRDEFISIKTESIDLLNNKEESSKELEVELSPSAVSNEKSREEWMEDAESRNEEENPVKDEINELIISEDEYGSCDIVERDAVPVEEDATADDTMALDGRAAPSSKFERRWRTLKCFHCGEIRQTMEEIAQHFEETHKSLLSKPQQKKDRKHVCNICQKTFKYNYELKKHRTVHSHDRPFECNQCNKLFKCKEYLKSHIINHMKDKPFKCTECDYKSHRMGDLKRHISTHREQPFKCTDCSYSSTLERYFKAHMLTHSDKKSFKCSSCSYRTSVSQNLKKHMFLHTGEKPYQCDLCDYKCPFKGSLKIHMRSHAKVKPFRCRVCDYSCTTPSQLRKHVPKHTGEEMHHKCDLCPYSCADKWILKRHELEHSKERPFKCTGCNYRCKRKYDLKKHWSRKHWCEDIQIH